jgi:hypothetical protein
MRTSSESAALLRKPLTLLHVKKALAEDEEPVLEA